MSNIAFLNFLLTEFIHKMLINFDENFVFFKFFTSKFNYLRKFSEKV